MAPAPVRSPEEAERKRNLQRALDGLTPGLQDVEMAEGQQHDICGRASDNEFEHVRSGCITMTCQFLRPHML